MFHLGQKIRFETIAGNNHEFLYTCLEKGCSTKLKITATDTHCNLGNITRHLEKNCWLVSKEANKQKRKISKEASGSSKHFFDNCKKKHVEATVHQDVELYTRIRNEQGPPAEGEQDFQAHLVEGPSQKGLSPIPSNPTSKSTSTSTPHVSSSSSKNLLKLAGRLDENDVSEH